MGDSSATVASANIVVPDAPGTSNAIPTTRGYQQEMLEESLHRNIVVAIDTGSGKTLIAVLRIKHEIEREQKKVSWFFAPTVALCEQQKRVIQEYLPVSVGLISGALEPNQWKDSKLWKTVLRTHRVIVSTPQVLLDALRHGYVSLGKDISLLVFDEAHHAVDNHPYNRIMQEFYILLPPRSPHLRNANEEFVRPMVLGLTASPIYGGNVEKAFRSLESNLDAVIRTPRRNREELSHFVHRPVFKHMFYEPLDPFNPPFSANLAALNYVVDSINIDDDPYVISLRKQLDRMTPGSADYHRIDQKLSKTISKQDTFTHRGLRDFARTATDICNDLGAWAADWYVYKVTQKAMNAANPYNNMMVTWKNSEKAYLLGILQKAVISPISYYPEDIADDCSDKVRILIECLLAEKFDTEDRNESYSGLIFVQRRDAVLALREVLIHHPFTKGVFNVGFLLGTSDSGYRHSFLDISRHIVDDSQEATIADFKIGEKNLIVSTSVAEEGIDIQACGSVIRWDPPPNMASWVQSRGRARKQKSTFTLLFEDGAAGHEDVKKWEKKEEEMIRLYNDPERDLMMLIDETDEEEEDDNLELRIESTGAVLTLHSAVSHLAHFCAVIPNTAHVDNRPIYDVDPPEYKEGWHSFDNREITAPRYLYTGPYGSKVTLPRTLPLPKREYATECIYKSKISAHRHAAFMAYKALYEAELLNENLLPITSAAEPHMAEEVAAMLADVEKRASTANVSLQMNPWLPDEEDQNEYDDDVWWCSRISVDGLPSLRLFTRVKLDDILPEEGPFLYRQMRDPQRLTLESLGPMHPSEDWEIEAQEYTRRLFWSLNGSRMNWDHMDFSYLLLPEEDADIEEQQLWEDRRAWSARYNKDNSRKAEDDIFANAELFGKEFSYPTDLTVVSNGFTYAKRYQFVKWRTDPLSEEEEGAMRKDYEKLTAFLEITYPLLEVRQLPPRTNFLLPLTAPKKRDAPPTLRHRFFLPNKSSVTLLSFADTEYAFLLPSILRIISLNTTTSSLRRNLFSSSPNLGTIPLQLLRVAMTAPVSCEAKNYQRLETLGDTVLKFMTGIQLLAEYPLWHEGYLTKRKDHTVSNVRLAKENVKRHTYQWIIRDQMLGKKWKPLYLTPPPNDDEDEEEMWERQAKQLEEERKKRQELSTKVLADVMESLIGAAFLHGGYPLGFECCRLFDLGLKWNPVPARIAQILSQVEPDPPNLPSQLAYVEEMLGYTFSRKLLLIEALTHASYQDEFYTPSYERMEFLGDSVLDMLVTDYLYHAPGKEYSPGHIHLRRSAVVNGHTLAYICLRTKTVVKAEMPGIVNGRVALQDEDKDVHLWQCLLHSSSRVLSDLTNTSKRYKLRRAEIEETLEKGVYPWASLTRLQAPKFFSDIVESVIGAVFLDSDGNMDVARDVIKKLGIWDILEHIVKNDVDVLHPVSRLSLWASKRDKELNYKIIKDRGNVTCTILLDGKEELAECDIYYGKASQDEVKFAAAEKAIEVLKLRNVGANYMLKKKVKPDSKSRKRKTRKEGKGKEMSK